jgi:hypothetical protein
MRPFLSILAAGVWISISEFLRNQFLLIDTWREHYNSLGLEFPEDPINGAIWGIWSFSFALLIWMINRKNSFLTTTLMAWLAGFVLMWIETGNMLVLPFEILTLAIPLSVIEVVLAVWIIRKLDPSHK